MGGILLWQHILIVAVAGWQLHGVLMLMSPPNLDKNFSIVYQIMIRMAFIYHTIIFVQKLYKLKKFLGDEWLVCGYEGRYWMRQVGSCKANLASKIVIVMANTSCNYLFCICIDDVIQTKLIHCSSRWVGAVHVSFLLCFRSTYNKIGMNMYFTGL